VYSGEPATSTGFEYLQALHFQALAVSPQGTAPFSVQSLIVTGVILRAQSCIKGNWKANPIAGWSPQ
jgi:hypothetical protein